MMIEAELIHSRGAEAEMLFPVLRDSEVASNWQDFVMNKVQVTGHPHQNDSEPCLAPLFWAHRISQLAWTSTRQGLWPHGLSQQSIRRNSRCSRL